MLQVSHQPSPRDGRLYGGRLGVLLGRSPIFRPSGGEAEDVSTEKMHVCVRAHVFLCMQARLHAGAHACVCMYVYVLMRVCTCMDMSVCLSVCLSVCMYVCMYVCTYDYVCLLFAFYMCIQE